MTAYVIVSVPPGSNCEMHKRRESLQSASAQTIEISPFIRSKLRSYRGMDMAGGFSPKAYRNRTHTYTYMQYSLGSE